MKKYVLTLAISVVALFVNAQNGAVIEYKISSNNGGKGILKVNYSEFGSQSEFNFSHPQMPSGGIVMKSLIQRSNPDVVYSVNDPSKTYSETKIQTNENEDPNTYIVKKIGEEVVNGYKCTHFVVIEGQETSEEWTTKDIKEYEKYAESYRTNKRMTTLKRDKAIKDAGCDGIPVKMIKKGNKQEGDFTMELVKLENKTFLKSDFDLPAGYTKSEGSALSPLGFKTQQEIMNMSPEERNKYIEEIEKKYGK